MAKRITTGKRDREKTKQEKRKEKLKRKEDRQSAGSRSFEDMIAYVDENGNLRDTPPENPKEEIDVSTIEVSVPKREEIEDVPLSGIVDYFNDAKGFGFIRDLTSGEKIFFHISSAPENIAEGNKVTYDTERGPRGLNAINITLI